MQPYVDRSGRSGIVAYELGDSWIKIRFRDGDTYLYDANQPGAAHVRAMARLARAGAGLNTYISRHVRDRFAGKLP